jgi:hypothetical protein
MSRAVAHWLVTVAGAYALVGLLFAVLFAWRGAERVEPVAHEGTTGFRLLLIPGAATLWPWLMLRWWRARQ